MLGALTFSHPALLLGLLALPLLWLLLRLVPPAPVRRRFPAIRLLLGLRDPRSEADRTPPWLILLRAAAIAAAILGFARPVLDPQPQAPENGNRPLLILFDGGWGDAPDWSARQERALATLDQALRQGRPAALATLTAAPAPIGFGNPADLVTPLRALAPSAHGPDLAGWQGALPQGAFDTLWFSDGLDHPGRPALAGTLAARGDLTVVLPGTPLIALRPARFAGGAVEITLARPGGGPDTLAELVALGPDPSGQERELARSQIRLAAGASEIRHRLDLPPELRNRIQRFEILGQRHAAARSLTDDSLKRRKVALIAGASAREGLQLLEPTHYLRQALSPSAELIDGALRDVIAANPDVIILADVARLPGADGAALLDWVRKGGVLLRFAGPRLAAAAPDTTAPDPLLPVRLRAGGRDLGGTMSWGEPKSLAPFAETSPFHGLAIPADVTVSEQVLAEPDPDLTARTIASLADGTPLVTRRLEGEGQTILVHTTANADWTSLPLSGLFPQMLERLSVAGRAPSDAAALAGRLWVPERLMDGYGQLHDAAQRAGVPGEELARAITGRAHAGVPPGLYADGSRRIAVNALSADSPLSPAEWPAGTRIEGLEAPAETDLSGPLLAAAFGLICLDILASLWLSGRLRPGRGAAAGLAAVIALGTGLGLTAPPPAAAQTADAAAEEAGIRATRGISLAYVRTGDPEVDRISQAGLLGLSDQLWARTSVEPEPPTGLDLETDELAFFPFLYWPVTPDQDIPSDAAYARLNAFLRTGGMILFDTRDADLSGAGAALTPEAERLQLLAAALDIPPLDLLPGDHVLLRSFYILADLPGRQDNAPIWIEYSPPPETAGEGAPPSLRNANDGVTPVIIGGNDWASAWAVDDYGVALFPVGSGMAGEDQRELAFRAGINIVMHALTGNYKSDQVHVPALLERLGE